MNGKTQTLVVGIGSGHGDDQAGWRVIDSLAARVSSHIHFRKASVPHDLVDWLGDCDVLHLVDGCKLDEAESDVHRFDVVTSQSSGVGLQGSRIGAVTENTRCLVRPPQLRSGGSHQIDLMSVLNLVDRLGGMPNQVVLWAIPGQSFDPGEAFSSVCEAAVLNCVDRLSAELCDA